MERLLSKDEARQLMELLKLDMEKYGDIPTMRKAYLRRCKELHPDKGGDENLMKKLNELYRKLESGLADLSEQPGTSSAEPKVGTFQRGHRRQRSMHGYDFPMHSPFDRWYIRDYDICTRGLSEGCICIMCTLRKKHKERFGNRFAAWIECYCYDCYLMWFGFTLNECTAARWQSIIAETPVSRLNL
ncbi:small T antigen [Betapolyomavirus equi]|uniref:Small t antigen n=1 Tax=Betapolyomavirus equi TaxID=1891761 RepID=I3QJF2_9POLY|nr:small T antigen [Betapolyomavirus equi]AFK09342.1 small T antigen [Betapolyomavirus equi]